MVNAKVIFMFPGQGSQSVGMGKDLAEEFSEYRETLEEASQALGYDMAKLCFEDPQKQIGLTEYTQPAILTASVATARVIQKRTGFLANLVAGHSLGEYSALVSLGAINFADAVKAVRFRGQAMQRAVPVGVGAMTAYIGAKSDEVVALCQSESKDGESVEVVNFNSASQLVLSGHKTAVDRVSQRIASEKMGRAIPLPVSAPFHSRLMEPAAKEMQEYLENTQFHPFSGSIVANVDAGVYDASSYMKNHLVRQLASAVLWTQSLKKLQEIGGKDARFVEVGPGNVLQGLLKKTLDGAESMGTNDAAGLKAVLNVLEK